MEKKGREADKINLFEVTLPPGKMRMMRKRESDVGQ